MAEIISPTEEAIVRALGRFHYCTSKHLLRLGVAKHPGPIQAALKTLRERSPMLVRSLDFGALPIHGRLPILYALTERGADLLLEAGTDPQHAQWVKSAHLFANDYVHRCQCVDLHISLALWLETESGVLETIKTYYGRGQHEGTTARPATAMTIKDKVIAPDLIATFTMPDGVTRLLLIEQHNGDDARRLFAQVQTYCHPGTWAAIEDAQNYPHGARLLLVFEKQRTLEKLQALAAKDDTVMACAHRLFLKTHEETTGGFYGDWEGLGDVEARELF